MSGPSSLRSSETVDPLVGDLLAGKPDAFQTFFDVWFPRVHRFAAQRTHSDREARELTRRILRRALEELPARSAALPLARWMRTVAEIEARRSAGAP